MSSGRSLMAKKNGGIKESTDSSSTTIEDDDTKGEYVGVRRSSHDAHIHYVLHSISIT